MSQFDKVKKIESVLSSRKKLWPEGGINLDRSDEAAEGGCGVIGMASNERLPAKHMLRALGQMRNRGNGKGGGIAAAGLSAKQFGVSEEQLHEDYLLAIAYLDASAREEVEAEYVRPAFEVDHTFEQSAIRDFEKVEGLDVRPPDVVIYFVRPRFDKLDSFREENQLDQLSKRELEDEYVYQNSFRLNTSYYASLGDKRAFVLSHAKNLLVLKMVGYGDDVIRYYKLEGLEANVWIGHHRYPTKGRVWHPGGAHPFIGLNEALVHNGDFANHASISEYLAQRNIYPLYLTDTEVAVQVFDLLYRNYRYPLEYVIEAMAPTTERDFTLLPPEKQDIYGRLQASHIHASPDGPWFFLIAQSDLGKAGEAIYRLTGITDTSMLRPQVFALQESGDGDEKVSIGFAASEKQAIDAALDSLSEEDARFWNKADRYWNARGGSHTDGGAFLFSVHERVGGKAELVLTDKFGEEVRVSNGKQAFQANGYQPKAELETDSSFRVIYEDFLVGIRDWDYADVLNRLEGLIQMSKGEGRAKAFDVISMLIDRRYPTGKLRRSSLLSLYEKTFNQMVANVGKKPNADFAFHAFGSKIPKIEKEGQCMIVDARGFPAQGEESLSREIHRIVDAGFRKLKLTHVRGHRFIGSGLGVESEGVEIDVYGSSGDYLASGLDGAHVIVHNNGQDQISQIMKKGRLVVHGDVGQTFMYGAKGGEAYILGNAAGRPLINAVGRPRVVINGTCLDYLAESFMAGDPLDGGGFAIVNGMRFDEEGKLVEMDEPYPGGNLFSLASGGALYVRDPHGKLSEDQLNGGEYVELSDADWELIRPYLEENERLFGVRIEELLTVNGVSREAKEVYRKIQPGSVRALQAEEAWVNKGTSQRVGFH